MSFEMLGRISPAAMQCLCEAIHALFPQPGHQCAACFANIYRQVSVGHCRYLSRMRTAAAGVEAARRGSAWIRGDPEASNDILH
jgi:hypothetical protein